MNVQNKSNMFSNSPSDKQSTLLTKKTGNNSPNTNFNFIIDFTFINIISKYINFFYYDNYYNNTCKSRIC